MAALVDNSVKASDNTGGGATTTLETASFAVAGSNRVLYVLAGSGAGTPVDPTAVKWGGSGGTSLTQIGTTLDLGSNVKMSLWRLIAPTATTSTIHVTWGAGQDERWIIGVSVKDTDQTTPNGTLASATGTGTGPTVAATTTSGNLVLDFMSWLDGGGSSWTVTDDVPDSLQEIEGATLQYEGAGASRETAAGTSTTTSWTISGGGGNNWGIFALQINEATGAPFSLEPSGALAISGTLAVAGDITAQQPNPFGLTPTAAVGIAGTLAASGDVSMSQPWELDAPLVLSMAGTLGVAGDLAFSIPFALAPTSALSITGALGTSGTVGSSNVPRRRHRGAVRRNYVIREKLYRNITNEELAYLVSRELIDIGREDIRVAHANKKARKIGKDAYASLQGAIEALNRILPDYDEAEDEEALLALL